MSRTQKSRKINESSKIKDEPGAEHRFTNILKRALNTPPKRKQTKPTRQAKKGEAKG